jgi:hypothetical protein
MKIAIIFLLILVVVVLILLAVVLVRLSRRSYQRYTGLERQRASAKQSRETGADRLKTAERYLIEAQRELVGLGKHREAQSIEAMRLPLSTLADRLRHATYGYSPIGSPNPVHEAELADLQERDADTILDAQTIVDLADNVRTTARNDETPDLQGLQLALDRLRTSLDRRGTVT